MVAQSRRIAVLGAGLQGACVALALASPAIRVDLYERNDKVVAEASVNNEGKIHLGYVYAKDRSLATARLMVEGAFTFQTLLEHWLGHSLSRLPVSSPFVYAIHRASLVGIDDCAAHFQKVAAIASEYSAGRTFRYFGRDPLAEPVHLSNCEVSNHYNAEMVAAAFQTEEVSIDPEGLAPTVEARLAGDPNIMCLTGRTVTSVEHSGDRLAVISRSNGEEDVEQYDFVINTLWSNRLKIDATLGVEPHRTWSHRFKYYMRLQCPDALPSTTIVLGAFGDVVNYGNGTLYLSWYPSGLKARTSALSPPDVPFRLQGGEALAISSAMRDGIGRIVPSARVVDIAAAEVKGGWIFAWGENDITDPASELHQRFDVGIRRYGRYITIDTGKLTTAPLFASRVAALLGS